VDARGPARASAYVAAIVEIERWRVASAGPCGAGSVRSRCGKRPSLPHEGSRRECEESVQTLRARLIVWPPSAPGQGGSGKVFGRKHSQAGMTSRTGSDFSSGSDEARLVEGVDHAFPCFSLVFVPPPFLSCPSSGL